MAVERFHSPQDLAIVPAIDQTLGVSFDRFGQEGKWALVEGVLLWSVLFSILSFGHL